MHQYYLDAVVFHTLLENVVLDAVLIITISLLIARVVLTNNVSLNIQSGKRVLHDVLQEAFVHGL